jgi:hypothetical protein
VCIGDDPYGQVRIRGTSKRADAGAMLNVAFSSVAVPDSCYEFRYSARGANIVCRVADRMLEAWVRATETCRSLAGVKRHAHLIADAHLRKADLRPGIGYQVSIDRGCVTCVVTA